MNSLELLVNKLTKVGNKKLDKLAEDWGTGTLSIDSRSKGEFCDFVKKYYDKFEVVCNKSFEDYIGSCTEEELLVLVDKTYDILMHEKACCCQVMQ